MIDQIGVVTTAYGHFTLGYTLASIAASGFGYVELWGASPHYSYADFEPEQRETRREEIRGLLKENGLSMPVFYPEQMNKYTLNIAAAAPYTKKFSMDRVLEYVDDTEAFGAGAMMLGTGWYHLDAPGEEKYRRSVASIQQVADYAASKGLTMLIEPAAPYIGSFVWDLDTLRRILKDVGMDNVKACLDVASILDAGDDTGRWYDALDGRVGHIHFADRGGRVPGTNGGDVAGALRELEGLGYQGTASLNITFRDCCLVPDRTTFESGIWLDKEGFSRK